MARAEVTVTNQGRSHGSDGSWGAAAPPAAARVESRRLLSTGRLAKPRLRSLRLRRLLRRLRAPPRRFWPASPGGRGYWRRLFQRAGRVPRARGRTWGAHAQARPRHAARASLPHLRERVFLLVLSPYPR